MSDAIGIHAHPSYKLGFRPKDTARDVLKLNNYLQGVPVHPSAVDHSIFEGGPGLYGNDRFGVCGPTEIANDRRLITTRAGQLIAPTQLDVFDLYRRSGNPDFDPNTGAGDNGVDMTVMMSALISGGIGGTAAVGFAAVDVTNSEELSAAMDIFGSVHLAVDLQVAQQGQTSSALREWKYQPSAEWGGHAILMVKYNTVEKWVYSWAELIGFDQTFEQHQLQEAYVVIWPEHLRNPALYESVDMAAFAADYTSITHGKVFPGPITPSPAPTTKQVQFTPADYATLQSWSTKRHVGINGAASAAWKRGTSL